jgi:hypothetical protein
MRRHHRRRRKHVAAAAAAAAAAARILELNTALLSICSCHFKISLCFPPGDCDCMASRNSSNYIPPPDDGEPSALNNTFSRFLF